MQEQSVLLVKDLKVSFEGADGLVAVNRISFSIEKRKTLAIVGESGSGKSLTALALMDLLPKGAIMEGEIVLNGIKVNDVEDKQVLRGKEMGMIFQEPMSSLNPVMKVGKQIAEAILAHHEIGNTEAKKQAKAWLAKVQLPSPEKMYDRYPHQLSGGQKQRVMIAMAMCNNPGLLIADEPTTALDVTVQAEIIELMGVLQKEYGTAMIFITHDLGLASKIADEILVMYKGEMTETGPIKEVLSDPKNLYTKALLACRPSLQQKGKRLPVVADFMEEGSDIVKREDAEVRPIVNAETILEVNDLKVWFSEKRNLFGKTTEYFKAVEGVSFNLHKGEVLGLVGESGCGKSTLSRSLMGLLPVNSGQILFRGKDLAHIDDSEWRRVRRQIQMIFQDPYSSLNPRMSIGDMLMEPMMVHGIVAKNELEKESQRLLDIVHLPKDSMKRYAHQFSGGQRQRISIARALALRPELLICDESVSALDVSVQAQILNLLKELQAEFQLSYLFISHDLAVVHYMSDRVMVMSSGRIVESGDAEQVLRQPENEYTRRLVRAVPGI